MISFVKTHYLRLRNLRTAIPSYSDFFKYLLCFLKNNIRSVFEISGICFSFFFTLIALILTFRYSESLTVPYIVLYLLDLIFILVCSFSGFLIGSSIVFGVAVRFLVSENRGCFESLWIQGLFLVLFISSLLFFWGLKSFKGSRDEWLAEKEKIVKGFERVASVDKSYLVEMTLSKERWEKQAGELSEKLMLKDSEYREVCEKLAFFDSEMQSLMKTRTEWIESYDILYQKFLEEQELRLSVDNQAHNQELISKINTLNHRLQKSEEEIKRIKEEYLLLEQMNRDLVESNEKLKNSEESVQRIREEYSLLEQMHQELRKENDTLLNSLQNAKFKPFQDPLKIENEPPSGALQQNTTRYKGLYYQLREQFQDKDRNLFLTRQEAFRAKNELAACKRKEELLLDYDNQDVSTIGVLVDVITELEKEVSHLEELISHNWSL